ncbi:hypothetical protein OC842_001231 [Tilletia horrida]|uniref:Uncharacterized protein n=1 Tax=Tilletia horrida TaxID=155126 RepID=A0AAN6GG10_9BASI|nr:hypothetical protein OC842_001231 [Tilletia horrida]
MLAPGYKNRLARVDPDLPRHKVSWLNDLSTYGRMLSITEIDIKQLKKKLYSFLVVMKIEDDDDPTPIAQVHEDVIMAASGARRLKADIRAAALAGVSAAAAASSSSPGTRNSDKQQTEASEQDEKQDAEDDNEDDKEDEEEEDNGEKRATSQATARISRDPLR